MTISDIAARLERLDLQDVRLRSLRVQADMLAGDVRAALSHVPGEDHAYPWVETGGLVESIGVDATADAAVVGSTAAVGLYQELGTVRMPPRPFLAPVASVRASEVAGGVGAAVAAAIAAALGGR